MLQCSKGPAAHLAAHLFVALLAATTAGCLTAHGRPDELPRLHADVAAFDWMVGRWQSPERASELWVPLGDALVGVSCSGEAGAGAEWEVMMIRRETDGLIFAAMPAGAVETRFTLEKPEPRAATFTNPQHDFPQSIRYWRSDDKAASLSARIWTGDHGMNFGFAAVPPERATVLEERDRAFAADSTLRGAEAWYDAFDDRGALGRGASRVEGKAAIRDAMRETLPPGAHLDWSPNASLLCAGGDLGFTAGSWRFTVDGKEGTIEKVRGAYVTVWRRASDNTWRAIYDVGDPEQPPH